MEENIIELKKEDNLLRRAFYKDPNYVREDMTVTSFAFKLRKNETGLSVDIERLTTYEQSIINADRFRLFAVTVGVIQLIGLDCEHKPLENNYAHAEITKVKSNSHSSLLAKNARYIPYP